MQEYIEAIRNHERAVARHEQKPFVISTNNVLNVFCISSDGTIANRYKSENNGKTWMVV